MKYFKCVKCLVFFKTQSEDGSLNKLDLHSGSFPAGCAALDPSVSPDPWIDRR